MRIPYVESARRRIQVMRRGVRTRLTLSPAEPGPGAVGREFPSARLDTAVPRRGTVPRLSQPVNFLDISFTISGYKLLPYVESVPQTCVPCP